MVGMMRHFVAEPPLPITVSQLCGSTIGGGVGLAGLFARMLPADVSFRSEGHEDGPQRAAGRLVAVRIVKNTQKQRPPFQQTCVAEEMFGR